MVNFKACPRCKGDMSAVQDRFGEYWRCLQCGHSVNIGSSRPQFAVSKVRLKPGRPRKRKASTDVA
jgi:ribosomal protein L37AE/L43A